MSTQPQPRLTPEQYLELERLAEARSEFRDGEMVAMPPSTSNHSQIAVAIGAQLLIQLRGRPCFTYGINMRLYVLATGLYTYPDVMIVCGDKRFYSGDCVLNPSLIVEILSPTTEAYDRGQKFEHYQTIDSLNDYLLVAQDRPYVELFTRQPLAPQLRSRTRRRNRPPLPRLPPPTWRYLRAR